MIRRTFRSFDWTFQPCHHVAMLALVALLFLVYRWKSFGQLTVKAVPFATRDELRAMRRASKIAVLITLCAFSGSYFLPKVDGLFIGKLMAARCAGALNFGGLVTAIVFDLRSELTKKRLLARRRAAYEMSEFQEEKGRS